MQPEVGKINKVVVAMSGGVDSSVAAMLLHRQGVETIGVSMQVWDYRNHGGASSRATCCAPDDFCDARRVAAKFNIPYYVFDFEKTFRHEVIDKFVSTYARGETPNPCIDCNSKVKFKELRIRAETFGGGAVATGHYARIEKRDDGFHLLRGVDTQKDQSYFLYTLTQAELAKTLFPIGHLCKPQVRELAREAGLATAEKPESQDICFVSGTVEQFLIRIGGKRPKGPIVDRGGKILGEHEGIDTVTVGQRKGLGLGGLESPLYVLEIDAPNNRIIVGPKKDLELSNFQVGEVTWVSELSRLAFEQRAPKAELQVLAQLRHRHEGVRVSLQKNDDGSLKATFQGDWSTASPGQAAVFYDLANQEVLGGGRILPPRVN